MKLSGPIPLIKKSVNIFFEKNNLVYFLKIYSVLLPFSIFSMFQKGLSSSDYTSLSWTTGFYSIVGLISILVYFLVGLAGIYAVINVVNKSNLSVRATYKVAWKNIWKFSLLAILLFFIVMGGLILLIIPGIIFAIWYSFSRFVFVEKKVGIKESLSISKTLVVGKFWPILGRFIVFGLFMILVQMLLSIIPFGIGSLLVALLGGLFLLPSYLLFKELSA